MRASSGTTWVQEGVVPPAAEAPDRRGLGPIDAAAVPPMGSALRRRYRTCNTVNRSRASSIGRGGWRAAGRRRRKLVAGDDCALSTTLLRDGRTLSCALSDAPLRAERDAGQPDPLGSRRHDAAGRSGLVVGCASEYSDGAFRLGVHRRPPCARSAGRRAGAPLKETLITAQHAVPGGKSQPLDFPVIPSEGPNPLKRSSHPERSDDPRTSVGRRFPRLRSE